MHTGWSGDKADRTIPGGALAEPTRPNAIRRDAKSLTELVTELWQLVLAYFKQETVDPLKLLGMYVAYGFAGALCLGLGGVLLAVGGLRLLQTELHVQLGGDLTWVPYLIVVAVVAVMAAIGVSRIGKVPQGRRR